MNINDISKLYAKAITETFDERYSGLDIVDRSYLEESLLIKPIQDFYFSVGLRFIVEHLKAVAEEKRK